MVCTDVRGNRHTTNDRGRQHPLTWSSSWPKPCPKAVMELTGTRGLTMPPSPPPPKSVDVDMSTTMTNLRDDDRVPVASESRIGRETEQDVPRFERARRLKQNVLARKIM